MELSPRGAAKLGPGCAPTAPPPAAQWGRQGGRGLSRDPQSIHREGAQKPPAQTWSGAGKKDLGATAGRAVDGGRGLPLPPSTGDTPGAGPRGQDPRAGLYAATAAAARPEAPSNKHPGAAGTGQGTTGLPLPVRSPGQLREHRRGAGAGRGAPGASPPPGPAAPTRRRAAPLPAHRQDTVSSTLVPGTLPAAGSSAPGDAIPVRAPPLLRAASSRAAEAGAPGGGHGHGGPGPGGSAAPVNGGLGPGPRHGEEPEGGDGRPVGAAA